ncbi:MULTISPECIES: hypothetical protein [Aerosakkonema]
MDIAGGLNLFDLVSIPIDKVSDIALAQTSDKGRNHPLQKDRATVGLQG